MSSPEHTPRHHDVFRNFAAWTAAGVGSPWAFLAGLAVIVIWSASGPFFHFSDTWQLVVNTGTTIITFLMVFLIQHTQNRDSKALHMKLDELIRSIKGARNRLIELESCSDDELAELKKEFTRIREDAAESPTTPCEKERVRVHLEKAKQIIEGS